MRRSEAALTSVVVCMLMFSSCLYDAAQAGTEKKVSAKPEAVNEAVFPLPGGEHARVYYGEKIVYVLQQGLLGVGSGQVVLRVGNSLALRNRYVKLPDGRTGRFVFRSSAPAIAAIYNGDASDKDSLRRDPGEVEFKNPGKVAFSVCLTCKDESGHEEQLGCIDIRVEVIRVPVRWMASTDQVIGQLGLPDGINNGHVDWLETKFVDGVLYAPRTPRGIPYEHWFYSQYPGVIFWVEFDHLSILWSPGWRIMGQLMEALKNRNGELADFIIRQCNKSASGQGGNP